MRWPLLVLIGSLILVVSGCSHDRYADARKKVRNARITVVHFGSQN